MATTTTMSWKKRGKWKSCNNRGKQRNKKWNFLFFFEVTTKMKEKKSVAQTKQKKK
jgi:hypothetical protein